MKERPILFSGAMVCALLAGTKTQTRRALNARSLDLLDAAAKCGECHELGDTNPIRPNDMACYVQFCPYGQLGDRLWVREAWTHDARSLEECRAAHEDLMGGMSYGPYYRATEAAPDTLKWRPSIHMPRWASRILLEITDVRIERLQDISESDAEAEGCDRLTWNGQPGAADLIDWPLKTTDRPWANGYALLWESINGDGAWAANPWVWAVSFKRVV